MLGLRPFALVALACTPALLACGPDTSARNSASSTRGNGGSGSSGGAPQATGGAAIASGGASAAGGSSAGGSSAGGSSTTGYYAGQPAFCSRPGNDTVRTVFCGSSAPVIGGLTDLERLLTLSFDTPDGGYTSSYSTGFGTTADLRTVLVGHSTALSAQLVSPINPRAIILGQSDVLAFNRGIQQVELVSFDLKRSLLDFFLVTFEQACNHSTEGCTPSDLYTSKIESNWTNVTVQDDEELKDTPSDCRQCHERGLDEPILLMRELEGPWTHFFAPAQASDAILPEASGVDLLNDFIAAKGDESYAGVPAPVIRATVGLTLQSAVNLPQPLFFDGQAILTERWPYGPDGYAKTPSRSPTWDGTYEAFKRGEELPLPYFDPRATDAAKQAKLTAAYRDYVAEPSSAAPLPELSDIFPDDPQTRAEIGLQTEPGATPAQALVQACGTCHNDVLDQSVSRARFNVALSHLAPAELAVAIERLKTARGAPGAMPPAGRRQLDPTTLASVVDYLKSATRPVEDDALLEHAAQVGMAGGPKSP
ncbi:MAG TPA: c-type cytochrome [Polyangiaceae bacterium]|jgi:cytochrome c553|nr:c-type cytochrome [Polyangiaceae bacterium]